MTSTWTQNPALLTAALTTLLPFIAFVAIMVFTRAYPRLSARLSIAAISMSLAGALFSLVVGWHLEAPVQYRLDGWYPAI